MSHSDIVDTIKHLKANKSDGDVGLMSNHIIISSEYFQSRLGMMTTSVLTHGYQPKTGLLATTTSTCIINYSTRRKTCWPAVQPSVQGTAILN